MWTQYPEQFVKRINYRPRTFANKTLLKACITGRPNLVPIGRLSRHCLMKSHLRDDPHFKQFLSEMKIEIPAEYARTDLNLPASYIELHKYGMVQSTNFDEDMIWMAADMLINELQPYWYDSRKSTWEEVFHYSDKTTSPGFPWNYIYHDVGKFLDSEDVEYVYDFYHAAATDEPKIAAWAVSEKDEIRILAKIIENAIRNIIAVGKEHNFSLNRYCLDQNIKFYQFWEKLKHTVGMSSFGDWDRIIRALKFESNADGDYHGWDSRVIAFLMWVIAYVRWTFFQPHVRFNDKHSRRYFELYRQAISSVLIMPDGNVILKHGGIVTGFGNTITDNSLIHKLVNNYSYIHYEIKNSLWTNLDDSCYRMTKVLYYWVHGDNLALSWDPESGYDFSFLVQCATELGMSLDPLSEGVKKNYQIEYLSQTTMKVGRRYVPVPKTTRILNSVLMGFTKTSDPILSFTRACGSYQIAFWNLDVRQVLRMYIRWAIDKATRNGTINSLPWQRALPNLKSDDQIQAAYFGYEMRGFASKTYSPLKSCFLE